MKINFFYDILNKLKLQCTSMTTGKTRLNATINIDEKKMHKLSFTITNKLCATVICIHYYMYWQDFSKKNNHLKIEKFIS